MRKKVELAHCTYKPSGAGGGDYGIAYSTNKQELLTLADKLKREHSDTFAL
jgi:mevalonate kinase